MVIQVLAEQGLGRNAIARRMNVPNTTVTEIAQVIGVNFDRSQTEQALKARLTDLKVKNMAVAEGLSEDLTHARIKLRMANNNRDLAFAAKTISDLARAVHNLTPGVTEEDKLEEARDFLLEFNDNLRAARDQFETRTGLDMGSDEATRISRRELGLDGNNDEP